MWLQLTDDTCGIVQSSFELQFRRGLAKPTLSPVRSTRPARTAVVTFSKRSTVGLLLPS